MPFEFAPHLNSRSMPPWTPDRSSVALAVTVTLFKRGGRGAAAITDYSFDRSGATGTDCPLEGTLSCQRRRDPGEFPRTPCAPLGGSGQLTASLVSHLVPATG